MNELVGLFQSDGSREALEAAALMVTLATRPSGR
jgi:hypothetical protein